MKQFYYSNLAIGKTTNIRLAYILTLFLSLTCLISAKAQVLLGVTGEGGKQNTGAIVQYDNNTNTFSTPYTMTEIEGVNPYTTEMTEYNSKLYGMTPNGGVNNAGIIFEWNPVTNVYTKMYDFDGTNGANPRGSLTLFNGIFYGLTPGGGTSGNGVIFEWNPTTNIYTKKYDFNNVNGSNPQGDLAENGGKFYGMTKNGGANFYGVIFEWNPTTNTYIKKYDFDNSNGRNPEGSLTWSNTRFYGMTTFGGTNDRGVIFEWTPSTNTFAKRRDFSGARFPFGNLKAITGSTSLIGMASAGQSGTFNQFGSIFIWSPDDNSLNVVFGFGSSGNNGRTPYSSLIMKEPNVYYGMTNRGGLNDKGTLFEFNMAFNSFNKLTDFNGLKGESPRGSVTIMNGKAYGMTLSGGYNNAGVIFEWNPTTTTYTKKIDFSYTIASNPLGALTLLGGKAYGMSNAGGSINAGSIYEWTPETNILTKKIDFTGANGVYPIGHLNYLNGKFYGMTNIGGANNMGVIFEWDNVTNTQTIKTDFVGTNGSTPFSGLTAVGTKLYGMTHLGGTNNMGVLFEYDPVANTFTKKFDFDGTANGSSPRGSVVYANSKLYGVTYTGGANNMGVLFEYDLVGNIYTKKFDFVVATGSNPVGNLIQAGNNLYGMTNTGGANGVGVIFEYNLTTDTYTSKVDFDGAAKGSTPWGSLTLSAGKIYGMTYLGGASNRGTFFQWDFNTNTFFKKTDLTASTGANPRFEYLVEYSPKINLQGNNIDITNGDTTPTITDYTNIDNAGVLTPAMRTFTIQNTGNAPLRITNIATSNTTDFVVGGITFPTAIPFGASLTFTITLQPQAIGTKISTITILSNDLDKANYTFTVSGTAIYALPTTVRGNMINFDGADDRISLPTNPVFDLTDNFTVEAWIKISNTTGKKRIIHKNGWAFGIYNDRLDGVTYGVVDFTVSTGNPIAVNTWTHIAFVVQSNNLTYYINGVASGGYSTLNLPATTGIGIDIGVNGLTNNEYFQGNMDEFHFWNTACTQAQIRESMHLTLTGRESNLVAYYQFNETSGNAIDVISGNNGILQNGTTRIASEVAVARGTSQRMNVTNGLNNFTNAKVSINFTIAPADEFVAYQLRGNPYNGVSSLNAGTNTLTYYWIVRQFGNASVAYNAMNFTIPSDNVISGTDQTTPSNLKLYKRPDNSISAFPAPFASGTFANNATKVIQFTGFTSQTSFSQFEIGSTTSSLPITLLSFEGKRIDDNNVLLEWKTATEINNKGFEVETSENGLSFSKIAFVDGAGNSTNIKNYQFNANNANDAYYRLKQIDFNNDFYYSNIIFIDAFTKEIKIFPNPVLEYLTIENIPQNTKIVIIDVLGKVLFETITKENSLKINLQNWQKGSYFVKIGKETKKIIIE